MTISENIQWITGSGVQWQLVRNRSYKAKIQLADPEQIYNVPGKPGVVYNCLEDSYEPVGSTGFVVTGAAGEMWVIPDTALRKYRITADQITREPQEVDTVELDTVLAAVRIPADVQFTLEVDYGEKAVLKGNRPGIPHGEGDYVLVAVREENGSLVPDFTDSGRIVNGAVFGVLYRFI